MLGYYNYTVVLTYIGMLLGFAGTACAAEGQLKSALLCLLFAGFCDMFDGKIASTRARTEPEKRFGIQIDSLSDLICFGVLPGVLVWRMAGSALSLGVAGLYVLCALIRLAWFNVDEETRQNSEAGARAFYCGLPVTTAALLLPGAVSLSMRFGANAGLWGEAVLCLMGMAFLLPFPLKKPRAFGKILLLLCGAAVLCLVAGAFL